jgi:hypothetical protein
MEGRLHPSIRPKNFPKPSTHFLDDSQIFQSVYSDSFKTNDHKPQSAKAPDDIEPELRALEKKLFNEDKQQIQFDTLHMIYQISKNTFSSLSNFGKDKFKFFICALSLLCYHVLGIFISFEFVRELDIYSDFMMNLFFVSSIFFGVLGSCLIAPERHTRNITLLCLLSICIICVNFATISFSNTSTSKEDYYIISIPCLMSFQAFLVISLICCSFGSLLIYFVGLFGTNFRSILLFWIFSFCFCLMGCFDFSILGSISKEGINLSLMFIFTAVNILVVYAMPEDANLSQNKHVIK